MENFVKSFENSLSYRGGSLRISAHLVPNLADAPRQAADTFYRGKRAQHPLSRIGDPGNADKELQTYPRPVLKQTIRPLLFGIARVCYLLRLTDND